MTGLKEKRLEAGITQSQLAEKLDLNVRTLQYYEQGFKKIDHAKLDTILKLCIGLQCSMDDIIESEELAELYNEYMKLNCVQ